MRSASILLMRIDCSYSSTPNSLCPSGYLLLSREDSAHREHDLRSVFNGVRYIARTGNQWRFMPHDYPPWPAIYQQMQRWMRAGCFERLVEDTRILLREFAGRRGQPTAACIDSRTLQSTPESGARAGYD